MNVMIRSFNGLKYLSIAERSVITVVDDIGYVVDEATFDGTGGIIKVYTVAVAILNVETYISCRSCNGRVTEINSGVVKKRSSLLCHFCGYNYIWLMI